jgi:Na+-transporting NADH:ubiquinone oxidoreductase subunit NqrE
MLDPITAIQISSIVLSLAFQALNTKESFFFLVREYGFGGVVLWVFGSGTVWRMQLYVLQSEGDKVAMDFKASIQNESNMIAVAVRAHLNSCGAAGTNSPMVIQGSILAQIAITALSLSNLSQAHWVTRGFFTFSLVSAIMAVYYASRQFRRLGRHMNGNDIKAWIMNKVRIEEGSKLYGEHLPSPAAVLTISAPNMLLAASLNSLLIGLGIYLAYVWTRNLDTAAGADASRAVFITYVVSLSICYGIYQLSGIVVAQQSYPGFRDMLSMWTIARPSRQPGQVNENDPSDEANISMQSLDQHGEAGRSQKTPPTASSSVAQGVLPVGSNIQHELIAALRTAALLSRESAATNERVAQLYEHLASE